jgi:polyhydroxyalkanoate synthase
MTYNAQQFADNMNKISAMMPEIIPLLMEHLPYPKAAEHKVASHITQAFMDYYQAVLQKEPADVIEWQLEWWQRSASLWQQQWNQFIESPHLKDISAEVMNLKDKRFRSELWDKNWFFDTLRKQYLLNKDIVEEALKESEDVLDKHTAHLVTFYSKQWMDALSPSNYPWSNPEVLKALVESNGETLVRGMENLLADLRAGRISMTTSEAFELGKNIATSKGSVVFQNELLQLIQYEATTAKVQQTPVMIMPAWINKYYILDLQPENSMVKYLCDQGFTVFVVSWVNPDESHRELGFDDYLQRGAYEALNAVLKAADVESVHVTGYCLGGTLTACLLSWLHSRKEQHKVASATYLTTLIDFEDAGDLKVFVDETQIAATEEKMAERGYLEGQEMAVTFNLLRPVDLIWSFVVNNYLLGKTPFPFDLLYWNQDATRMPAKMHSFYLRNMYLRNMLVKPEALSIAGQRMNLTQITTPSFMVSTKEDHIAPWKCTYAATQMYQGEKQFLLAESGHIAGVISAPGKTKYGYWKNLHLPKEADTWLENATKHEESWWIYWAEWLKQKEKATSLLPARKIKNPLEDAPGSYVRVK